MSDDRAPFEALDAYQSGQMEDADAADFESELFELAAAGRHEEAAFVDRLSLIGQYLAPRGGLDVGSSRARIDQLIAAGLRVQVLFPEPGEPSQPLRLPSIDADAEIVVTHVPIDVRGYDSVDVIVERPDGRELKTFREIGFDPLDGTVYAVCEAPLARISMAVGRVRSRIIGKRAGAEHLIAQFETVSG